MSRSTYLIALGSNRRHVRHGGPDAVVRAAVRAMAKTGMTLKRLSGIHRTRALGRSEEHTSEIQSLMRISYAVFCLQKKKQDCVPPVILLDDDDPCNKIS